VQHVQRKVAQFIEEQGLEIPTALRLLDLTSEVGEVAKAYLESTRYGERPFVADGHWAEELGDALFSLMAIANRTGVDLERALYQVLKKYARRIQAKGHAGSGE